MEKELGFFYKYLSKDGLSYMKVIILAGGLGTRIYHRFRLIKLFKIT
jgi:hypothetical protein